MSRALLYMACPLRPTEDEIRERLPGSNDIARREAIRWATKDNIDRAMRWLAWLRRSFPETTFIAPWIASVLAGADDAQRAAGMADACAVIERCDGIVLCGGRISEGMRREMEHGLAHGRWIDADIKGPIFSVYSLADLREPPLGEFCESRPTFEQYAQATEDDS